MRVTWCCFAADVFTRPDIRQKSGYFSYGCSRSWKNLCNARARIGTVSLGQMADAAPLKAFDPPVLIRVNAPTGPTSGPVSLFPGCRQ
jgi:hypothetical protein